MPLFRPFWIRQTAILLTLRVIAVYTLPQVAHGEWASGVDKTSVNQDFNNESSISDAPGASCTRLCAAVWAAARRSARLSQGAPAPRCRVASRTIVSSRIRGARGNATQSHRVRAPSQNRTRTPIGNVLLLFAQRLRAYANTVCFSLTAGHRVRRGVVRTYQDQSPEFARNATFISTV